MSPGAELCPLLSASDQNDRRSDCPRSAMSRHPSTIMLRRQGPTLVAQGDGLLRSGRRFFLRAAARPTQRALFWMALISVSPPRFLQYLLTAVLLFAYLWKSKTGCVIEARK